MAFIEERTAERLFLITERCVSRSVFSVSFIFTETKPAEKSMHRSASSDEFHREGWRLCYFQNYCLETCRCFACKINVALKLMLFARGQTARRIAPWEEESSVGNPGKHSKVRESGWDMSLLLRTSSTACLVNHAIATVLLVRL